VQKSGGSLVSHEWCILAKIIFVNVMRNKLCSSRCVCRWGT